jgi:hypothetical protein
MHAKVMVVTARTTGLAVQAMGLAVFAAGCFLPPGPTSSSDSTPSAPASLTETFSGTLAVRGSSTGTFSVVQSGTVSVTIASLGAPADTTVGVAIGIPTSAGSCSYLVVNATAIAGSAAQVSAAEAPGQYCVAIYDVGKLTAAAAFTMTVAHP